ncbi:TIGR03619 family F420-dependent LLM class oxidoreductase [Saccharopolyspora pogona]|uniref:TIGR03619 family F420-dependent LLM class oxidoreductase n=1 Tax=Saccharopolyspora pogona TaxID=333966 RepID=UPI001681E078|nr:TIGR03619 family F420-dependent LLM class oxidoreductase [Saccharopolyspora pogona]
MTFVRPSASPLGPGVLLPTVGELTQRLGLTAMAQAAEQAGAVGLYASDHLLMLDHEADGFHLADGDRPPWPQNADIHEALTCCAAIAAVTSRCRIGAMIVAAQRNVLQLAKTVATLDTLSGGRMVLGVGAGWYREEFEALGYDFATRGVRTDEILQVLRSAWSGRPPEFSGDQITVPSRVLLYPRPAQPGVPLWVGGMSRPALRRAARFGDGWWACVYADHPTPDELRNLLGYLREQPRPVELPPLRLVAGIVPHDDDQAKLLPDAARTAANLGFHEIIIMPPWSKGFEAVAATISEVREALSM